MANGRKKHKLFTQQRGGNRPPDLFIRSDFQKKEDPVPHYELQREESLRRMAMAQWRSDPERFLQRVNKKHRGEA